MTRKIDLVVGKVDCFVLNKTFFSLPICWFYMRYPAEIAKVIGPSGAVKMFV